MSSSVLRSDIRIAIICALPVESQAVEKLFDTIYETKTLLWQKADGDRNAYTTGRIGRHNVVLTYMPGIGKVNATATAVGMNATFPNIELALVVGICGGSTYAPAGKGPTKSDKKAIYLGDVVVSTEIQQSDFGRETVDKFVVKGLHEGNVPLPSSSISALLHKLRGPALSVALRNRTAIYAESLLGMLQLTAPGMDEDILYQASYFHKHRLSSQCDICASSDTSVCDISQKMNCIELGCETLFQQRQRDRETTLGPRIFLGRISSSDSVKRNGLTRDSATATDDILAFEMEAAGVCAILPTLVVKGVCDYADSHKNKVWQAYAAAAAAACSKVLLEEWSSTSMSAQPVELFEEKKISPEDRRNCLASLDFSQLDLRLTNISFPHSRTCEWISSTSEFKTWLNDGQIAKHNQVLWIKGKPGCGKSTMMKHIHHTISRHLPKHILLSYFFHARGSELERTPLGMLRALLHQLLSHKPELLDKLIRKYPKQASSSIGSQQWTYEALESFFLSCARDGDIDNVTILIDALDECDSDEASRIANFCEDLSINSVARQTSCFICISIRHFPSIGMKTCIKLNLDEQPQHREDIQSYVTAKLHVEDEPDLVDQIIRKSNHVFLWAVLVVQSLNSAHDIGADNEALQEILSQIPSQLHAIFEKLLGPRELMIPETKLALQIVLHAFQPLKMKELRFLILAGTRSSSLRSANPMNMVSNNLYKYFITKSHGLLEVVRLPNVPLDGSEIVQFIHESVRDYFLARRSTDASILPNSASCHEAIARACLEGMSIVDERPEILHRLEDFDLSRPFQGLYMLRWVLYHIGKVQDTKTTIELLKWFSKVFVYGRTQGHLIDIRNTYYGLLCAIIECYQHGRANQTDLEKVGYLARLLRIVLNHGGAMFYILPGSEAKSHNDALRRAIQVTWLQGVDALLHAGANPADIDKRGSTILHYSLSISAATGTDTAEEHLSLRLIREMQERGHDFNDSKIQRILPLPFVCAGGSGKLVIALLEAGASLTAIDPDYGSPLDAVVRANRPAIAQILLEYGADPIIRYAMDCSPTEYAWHNDERDMARVLSAYRNHKNVA